MKNYIYRPNLAAVIAANTIISATPKTFNATPEQLQIVKGFTKQPLRFFTVNQFENLELAGNVFNDIYSSLVIEIFNDPQINLPMQLVSLMALEIAQQISTVNGCDDLGGVDVENPWVKYSNQLIKIAQSLHRAYSTVSKNQQKAAKAPRPLSRDGHRDTHEEIEAYLTSQKSKGIERANAVNAASEKFFISTQSARKRALAIGWKRGSS